MKMALFVVFLFCFCIIYLTEISRKEVWFDCRMATTYPYSIDVPRAVIEKCQKASEK